MSDSKPPATDFFFERQAFIPKRLGAYLDVHEGPFATGIDGRLYRYANGVYRPDGEKFAQARVRAILGERGRKNHAAEVVAWLSAQLPTITAYPPTEAINVRNGLIDWRTGVLKEHTPKHLSTVQLPVEWDAQATCPLIDKFLSEVLAEDAIDFVHEVFGYALYPALPFHRSVLLLGPGNNGKSVLLGLFRALVGTDNMSAQSLQSLGEQRFAVASLFGKLVNISGDLDARAIHRSDMFKASTGGDPLTGEFKNLPLFTFVSFALQLYSANVPPKSADQTEAWFRRFLIVSMPRVFEEGARGTDPDLLAKVTAPAELSGLLVHAIAGLRRLMERGGFALPESVHASNAAYREALDTVGAFLDECCLLGDAYRATRSQLTPAYLSWCKQDSKRIPVPDFLAALRQRLGSDRERKIGGTWFWFGLGLREV